MTAHSHREIDRRERFILVRINLAKGRTTDANTIYRRLSEPLADRAEVTAEDLTGITVENGREDWCFGRRGSGPSSPEAICGPPNPSSDQSSIRNRRKFR